MFNIKIIIALWVLIASFLVANAQEKILQIASPNQQINVTVRLNNGLATYNIHFNKELVLGESKLGLILQNADFSSQLSFLKASKIHKVRDSYTMVYAKRKINKYKANKLDIQLLNKDKQPIHIVFQVSNDGVAFKYVLQSKYKQFNNVTEEVTSFQFTTGSNAWLQPMQVAKTGWESTNPAYEENYLQNIPVGTPAPTSAGWVYPALFKTTAAWLLITEANLNGSYCATRLKSLSPNGEYRIGFPSATEVIEKDTNLPIVNSNFSSPWRIIAIGSLKTIMESNIGTDLAKPQLNKDFNFVKPGKASWSWINSKDNFITYDEQLKYINYAADMHWEYCLIDADWDRKIGYEKIKQLADYAHTKNVKLLLWYNSAGNWNTVKYTPKNLLLTKETRLNEFSRLKEMGIAGVKIDFFAGDGQSVIKYYIDILNDAADKQLLVNFHGATLPRGWPRTYPNLLTTEAVKGFEMVTFNQADADVEANHTAMLPFTRNIFDPMDFTPMNLYKIQTKVIRKTSSAFELALPIVFTSGIQHFAESPEGMKKVPLFVKTFLQQLPNSWDEVNFIDGEPGKYIVIARKSGNKWFIAGINGQATAYNINLDLKPFKKKIAYFIGDGDLPLSFKEQTLDVTKQNGEIKIMLKPASGFVMVLQ